MTKHNGKPYEFDVIIVGSGVAGALAAWKLSTYEDYRILILEAGDNGIGEGHVPSSITPWTGRGIAAICSRRTSKCQAKHGAVSGESRGPQARAWAALRRKIL